MNKDEMTTKIIDLCVKQHKNNSKDYIDILYRKINIIESQKIILLRMKPFWFQKNKMKIFNEELETINNVINFYIKEIEKEISIMN